MIINTPQQVDASFRAGLMEGMAGTQQADAGDAFAQLLMQLFGNLNLTGETETGDSKGDSKEVQTAPEEAPEENTGAMQMMAELLAANNLPFQVQPPIQEETAPVQLSGSGNPTGNAIPVVAAVTPEIAAPDIAANLAANLAAQLAPAMQENTDAPKAVNTSWNSVAAELLDGGEEKAQSTAPVVVEAGSSSGDTALFDGQMKFRQSVSEAQKALKEEREKKPAGGETVDVGALQQKVNAERPGMTAALREKTNAFQTKDGMVSQMKEHILKNLNDGNEEFTVKLKPESLGEITVKMTQTDGKISMSIVTASAQTAKLLNESVEALKNTLRPLQAEIREIVPRAEQPTSSQQSGFLGGFESFQQQQHFTGREQPQYYSGPQYQDADLPGLAEEEEPSPEVGLNTYI